MAADAPYKLLVEGADDRRVVPELVEAHGVEWQDERGRPRVFIEALGGFEAMLDPATFRAQLKSSGLRALGILADADRDLDARWRSIRARCVEAGFEIPEDLPAEGLVVTRGDGLRLGVWILPDNRSHGMLETFLGRLVPKDDGALWEHAVESHERAKTLGARCKPVHDDKARAHTWLAWQDPPGRQLHQAVMERMFEPKASELISWFRRLFELPL